MSNANDSAFPLSANFKDGHEVTYGLTKRELFAAMAMQGILSTETADDSFTGTLVAKRSVAFADALLAELAKQPVG